MLHMGHMQTAEERVSRNDGNGGTVYLPPMKREWLQLSPAEFESLVVAEIRKLGQPLKSFEVQHQSRVTTPDGEFLMDAVATFEALGGDFLVLVECKHHKNPIKRELVQVLADKMASARAQKAILFSSAPFQAGAIEYAHQRRIALVHMTEGGPVFETRGGSSPDGPPGPPEAHWVTTGETGEEVYRRGGYADLARYVFESSG